MNCSWCGKDQKDVKKLIAGGPNFNEGDDGHLIGICDECIDMNHELIHQKPEKVKSEYSAKGVY